MIIVIRMILWVVVIEDSSDKRYRRCEEAFDDGLEPCEDRFGRLLADANHQLVDEVIVSLCATHALVLFDSILHACRNAIRTSIEWWDPKDGPRIQATKYTVKACESPKHTGKSNISTL